MVIDNKKLVKQVSPGSFDIVGNILGPKPLIQRKNFELGRDNKND